jgi:hypothetical protein
MEIWKRSLVTLAIESSMFSEFDFQKNELINLRHARDVFESVLTDGPSCSGHPENVDREPGLTIAQKIPVRVETA